MLKSLFIILGLLFCINVAGAAKISNAHATHHQLKIDSTQLQIRQFNAAELNKYRNDPDFNYKTEKAAITLWDRFWEWVWHIWTNFWIWVGELLKKLFGNASIGAKSATAIKYLIIAIFAFMVVYIIFKLLGINLLSLFKKKKDDGAIPYTESIENIHEISFDEAIEGALAIKNYRLAVRLLYLRCLKQLSDNNLIHWKIDKTNTDYLNELTNEEQRRQFVLVTRQFEYIWYGDFPVDSHSFENINSIFQEFKRRLS
ncbi:MAG: DUF4129 domain-containing protein [Mucilaginibacter sp.]|uniref:DUF4129 domain-containing protein n=1 Tax=Mucilaginibacter sp. TaxID=1882438 RepID=UPI003265E417